MLNFTEGLNWDSFKTLFNPPTPDPMFPNVRVLHWQFRRKTIPLMHHFVVPSLTSLEIDFKVVPPFHSFPYSLSDLCPNIKNVRIHIHRPWTQVGSEEAISALVRRWGNLQVVICWDIKLDSDALSHLSRSCSLTNLAFESNAVVADHITSSDSMLRFSKLRELEIASQSLEPTSRLLTHTLLPAIETLVVDIDSCPPKHVIKSFFIGVQKSCHRYSLINLTLFHDRFVRPTTNHGLEWYHLTFDDIRPCMAFDQLRLLEINVASTVNLTDDELLQLASACPRVERLLINEEWGWNFGGGITPDGLLQLLQILRSLSYFCLAIDTSGYTRPSPALESARTAGFVAPIPLHVNVVDSIIQPESVDALAYFFGVIRQHTDYRSMNLCWSTSVMEDRPGSELSRKLWEDVFSAKAYERAKARWQSTPTIPAALKDE